MKNSLLQKWRIKETAELNDLDSNEASLAHRKIILEKRFLRDLYIDFYKEFLNALSNDSKGKVSVELGSGGGFLKQIIPNVITSDIKNLPGVDQTFSAFQMPFAEQSLDAVFGLDVLHHLPEIRRFFNELDRCLKPGGKSVFIEPANTTWGRFIWTNFHHEPFKPEAEWEFPSHGPMTSANGALPWIVFFRDRKIFEAEFPRLMIREIRFHTPLSYLLSGGFSYCQLAPSAAYPIVRKIEKCLSRFSRWLGMFMSIELIKKDS